MCPDGEPKEEKIEGILVLRNKLGSKLQENKKLEREELEFLKAYDRVISINNFGARPLSEHKQNIVRQIHTVEHDRPVSSYM